MSMRLSRVRAEAAAREMPEGPPLRLQLGFRWRGSERAIRVRARSLQLVKSPAVPGRYFGGVVAEAQPRKSPTAYRTRERRKEGLPDVARPASSRGSSPRSAASPDTAGASSTALVVVHRGGKALIPAGAAGGYAPPPQLRPPPTPPATPIAAGSPARLASDETAAIVGWGRGTDRSPEASLALRGAVRDARDVAKPKSRATAQYSALVKRGLTHGTAERVTALIESTSPSHAASVLSDTAKSALLAQAQALAAIDAVRRAGDRIRNLVDAARHDHPAPHALQLHSTDQDVGRSSASEEGTDEGFGRAVAEEIAELLKAWKSVTVTDGAEGKVDGEDGAGGGGVEEGERVFGCLRDLIGRPVHIAAEPDSVEDEIRELRRRAEEKEREEEEARAARRDAMEREARAAAEAALALRAERRGREQRPRRPKKRERRGGGERGGRGGGGGEADVHAMAAFAAMAALGPPPPIATDTAKEESEYRGTTTFGSSTTELLQADAADAADVDAEPSLTSPTIPPNPPTSPASPMQRRVAKSAEHNAAEPIEVDDMTAAAGGALEGSTTARPASTPSPTPGDVDSGVMTLDQLAAEEDGADDLVYLPVALQLQPEDLETATVLDVIHGVREQLNIDVHRVLICETLFDDQSPPVRLADLGITSPWINATVEVTPAVARTMEQLIADAGSPIEGEDGEDEDQ